VIGNDARESGSELKAGHPVLQAPATKAASAEVSIAPSVLAMFTIGGAEVAAGPMMVEMGRHWEVATAQIAWLPATYALIYAVFAILLGPLSDRWGRKALLVPGLMGFALGMVAIAFAPTFAFALISAAWTGFCAASMQPNALAIVNDAVRDPVRQATLLGRVFLGLTASFVLIPVFAAFAASRASWQATYMALALLAIAAAALAARLPPLGRSSDPKKRGILDAFAQALQVPTVRSRLASSYLWIGLSIGVFVLLAEILRRRFHMGTEAAGIVVGLFGAATLLGNSLVGKALQLAGSRQRAVLVGTATCALGALAVGVVPPVPPILAVACILLWALVYGATAPIHHGLLSGLSDDHRGTISAFNASLLNLGIMTVSLAAGRFFDIAGVEAVVGLSVLGMVLGFYLLFTINRDEWS
jgi:predicted MFS family arabinose efflux permease